MTMRRKIWRLTIAMVVLLLLLTFTPFVIPAGAHRPHLFGIPYTMWMGFAEAVLLLALTYLGTKVHPGRDE